MSKSLPFRFATALCLGLSLALLALPERMAQPVKSVFLVSLRPGQAVANSLLDRSRQVAGAFQDRSDAAERLAEQERTIATLRNEVARLDTALQAAEDYRAVESDRVAEPLLESDLVLGRIVGQAGQSLLTQSELLDVGQAEGLGEEAFALEQPTALIDRGQTADLADGQMVLSGRRVLGRLIEVGRHTSWMQRANAEGYRDVVQLGQGDADQRGWGPQGLLEGTGEPLCRIRLIPTTEPVSVGDRVYSASLAGVVETPLAYGRVVRVERLPGARHWEIWMQPAAADRFAPVAVLRAKVDPARLAKASSLNSSGR